MVRLLLVFLLHFLFISGFAQSSDLLLLKNKKGRTIETYFAGKPIYFTDSYGIERGGMIKKILLDTLYISFYDVRRAYTQWGTTVADTVSIYLQRYHYSEISSIPKDPQSFEFVRNGTIFMIGGVAYAALHVINAAIQSDKVDGKTMAIAGAVAVGGFIMHKLRKTDYAIGKKYKLQYVNMQRH